MYNILTTWTTAWIKMCTVQKIKQCGCSDIYYKYLITTCTHYHHVVLTFINWENSEKTHNSQIKHSMTLHGKIHVYLHVQKCNVHHPRQRAFLVIPLYQSIQKYRNISCTQKFVTLSRTIACRFPQSYTFFAW